MCQDYWPVAVVIKDIDNGAEGLRLDSRVGQIGTVSPTTCHRCDVSSKLCCPGANLRRWSRHSLYARRYTTSVMKIFIFFFVKIFFQNTS